MLKEIQVPVALGLGVVYLMLASDAGIREPAPGRKSTQFVSVRAAASKALSCTYHD